MSQSDKMEIVCCLSLAADIKVYDHLMPLANHPKIECIWVIRDRMQNYKPIPKVKYVIIPDKLRIVRFLRILKKAWSLGKRPEVKAFVSFNPRPYGLIALIAAKLNRKPVHLGFIGSDWNIHCKGLLGFIYKKIFKKADFITVTGPIMKTEMVAEHFAENKIAILPHSVDLNHFVPSPQTDKKYAAIYIGRLIALKNVNVILEAFEKILRTHPDAQFCIIGEGPEREKLQAQTQSFDSKNNIQFKDYCSDVYPYLENSKSLIIASSTEGLPFVLIEAICSGTIPISTPVGTIPDLLKDNHTALFFKNQDSSELAEKLIALITNHELYNNLQKNILSLRENFSFDKATEVWNSWINSITIEPEYNKRS